MFQRINRLANDDLNNITNLPIEFLQNSLRIFIISYYYINHNLVYNKLQNAAHQVYTFIFYINIF